MISKFGIAGTPPYICVMDNKQMTKLIKKGLGKKTFPFEYGNMKGTFRFVSVKELAYDYGEAFNWPPSMLKLTSLKIQECVLLLRNGGVDSQPLPVEETMTSIGHTVEPSFIPC